MLWFLGLTVLMIAMLFAFPIIAYSIALRGRENLHKR